MPLIWNGAQAFEVGAQSSPVNSGANAKGALIINSSPANLTFSAGTLGTIPILAYSAVVLAVNPNDALTFTVDALGEINNAFPQTFLDLNFIFTDVVPSYQPLATAVGGGSSAALYDGQVTVANSAAAIGSQQISEVLLTADLTNAAGSYVYVGNSGSQSTPLAPGQSMSLTVASLSLIYAKGSVAGLKLDYLARS